MFNPQKIPAISTFIFLVFAFANFSVNAQTTAANKSKAPAQIAATKEDELRPRIYVLDGNNVAPDHALSSPSNDKIDAATAALEKQAFELLNLRRHENGLEPLRWSDTLAKVARLHSHNMAEFGFFGHKGLDGLMVDGRADRFGISRWQAIGENIAYNRGFKAPVEFAYEGWMNSPSHRQNILAERWKEAGIGIVVDGAGTYYFTQVFLQR